MRSTLDASEIIASLKPTAYLEVMEVVEAAGISVANWSMKKDGTSVQKPRANPHYVYEWGFGGGEEPTLLCVWHRSLETEGGRIIFEDSVRNHALGLDRVAIDQNQPRDVKSRARSQAKRARKFDSKLQRAFRVGQPVRVVLLEGKHRDEAEIGWGASEVEQRLLDPAPWYVHDYRDDDGFFRLVRLVPPPDVVAPTIDNSGDYDALNDLDAPPPGNTSPVRVDGKSSGFKRDDAVREFVRKRSMGFCELCNTQGFLLPDGRRYIETHHMLWLSDGGPDTSSNVIALCANHHREVHYAQTRKELEQEMLDRLKTLSKA